MELGQKVKFNKCLTDNKANSNKWTEKNLDEIKTGIIAGKRTLQQGYLDQEVDSMGYAKGGFYWVATDYVPVYLVACDMRGFYRVPIDCVEERKGEQR